MKQFLQFFLITTLLLVTIQTHAQVLMDYVKIEKPDYCLKDSVRLSSIIGHTAKIWHNGGIYPTINKTNTLQWPSKELKAKSGLNGWGAYYPQPGDTGTIIHIFKARDYKEYIYLLQIRGYYVPIKCSYLTSVSLPDCFTQEREHNIRDSIRNVEYAAGCKFKLWDVNGSWSRAGLTNIDKISELFACDLKEKGIDTIMLCKHIFDNGSLPIESAYVLWLEKGEGFVKAFFNNSKHQPTENKIVPFDSKPLFDHFLANRIDTITSEPESKSWISHSMGYSIQVDMPGFFFRERLTNFIIGQDKTHPKSICWTMISEKLAPIRKE